MLNHVPEALAVEAQGISQLVGHILGHLGLTPEKAFNLHYPGGCPVRVGLAAGGVCLRRGRGANAPHDCAESFGRVELRNQDHKGQKEGQAAGRGHHQGTKPPNAQPGAQAG
jgi:hypothetical protein